MSSYFTVRLSDAWLDKQLSGVAQGELAGGGRNDPIFNRLAADIYEAAEQIRDRHPDRISSLPDLFYKIVGKG